MKVMRTKALLILLLTCPILSKAQSFWDAYTLSKSDYEGTARTVSMGNAFTALGGDLGSMNINPAGLAVAGYGQFTLTPGVSVSVNSAQGTMLTGNNTSFEKQMKSTWSKFNIPNVAVSAVIDTKRMGGLKSISLGFAYNRTQNYMDDILARGQNSQNSFIGSIAASASGTHWSDFDATDAYDYLSWKQVIAWKSGMISTFGEFDDEYISNAEGFQKLSDGSYETFQTGTLNQSYRRIVSGNKADMVLNLSFNISDEFYFGINLGITDITYIYDDYFTEEAVNTNDFPLDFGDDGKTSFQSMKYQYAYSTSGEGLFGKFGFIYAPRSVGIRIGAAIQTPTALNLSEIWQSTGETTYTDSSYDMYASSPTGEYSYSLITPWSANAGVAMTFGGAGLVSIDYELIDYSSMKLKEFRRQNEGNFEPTNTDIRDFMGASHRVRAGVEFKPIPEFAVRAGYVIATSPERYFDKSGKRLTSKALEHTASAGCGYSSKGSFFADFAVQMKKMADQYIYPYDDYLGEIALSPEILNMKSLWNVYLTLGFRF